MPRNSRHNSSPSRSRSKHNKRYRKSSSDSELSRRKSSKYQKNEREGQSKASYMKGKSDIKNHFIYENVKISHKRDIGEVMEEIKRLLNKAIGPVEHVTKISKDEDHGRFSFAVGFKYDIDALKLIDQGGFIKAADSKLEGRPSLIFGECLQMLREALKQFKKKEKRDKSQETRKQKQYKRSTSSEKNRKKKRYNSRDKSYDRHEKMDKHQKNEKHQKRDKGRGQKLVWMFGLPCTLKGKEVPTYLADHTSGPFSVNRWQWVRVKGSNCEFMEVALDEKKASKLLALREEQQIEGCPCIITQAQGRGDHQEIIKQTLKDYQFKITFSSPINPALLYKALNDSARVVQIVSSSKLVDGQSNSFTVTLASASKARQVRRLGVLSGYGVKVEECKGQLVYRPTKNSKLTDSEV